METRTLQDRFLIRGPLGRGGSARVWSAVDRQTGRAVAVKILEQCTDTRAVARFEREVRVLQRLRHPHVIRIHDHGLSDPRPWMAMELATRTLRHVLRSAGPATLEQTLSMGLQLCGALQAAHDADVIHRDVKLSNILIMPDGIRVSDFGIARIAGSEHTGSGDALGSLAFMAPEQRLDPRAVSPRSDVYAAAVTLAVFATQMNPFDLYLDDLDSPRWLRVPEPIRAVLYAATRQDPDDRTASARDLADALMNAAPTDLDPDRLAATYARSLLRTEGARASPTGSNSLRGTP